MSHILETRVAETTTSTGTGGITLGGALTAHRAFADVCGTGDTTEYVIYAVDTAGAPTGDWEEGKGTYSAANTLTRTTVTRSSNSNSPVNFSAGTKIVILTPLGSRVGAVPQGGNTGQVLSKSSTNDLELAWIDTPASATVDATPTDGSSNAVSSNGVFDALAGKADTGHNHAGVYDPAGTAASAVAAHAGTGGTAHANAIASGAAGFMTGADKAKLDGIAAGATVAPVASVAGRTGAVTLTSADLTDTTSAGRALLDDADAAAQRTTLGLGDAATKAVGTTAGTVAAGDHSHSNYETSINDAKLKSVTVLLPVANDEVTLFRARAAMTITKLVAVGGGFTYTVRKAADRSATGTEVVTGGSTVTSTTTGDAVTSFNSASIASGDYVWIKLTSVTGTPASFNLTMEF